MKKLELDMGIREYRLGAGVLRFNPTDPNVYARFLEAAEEMKELEQTLLEAQEPLAAMESADGKMKALLGRIFGPGNDFQTLLGGVNLLAVGKNGQRLITNVLLALEPILVSGAQDCARVLTQQAKEKAQQRRENRC